jgi:hypothetical protein
VVHLAAGELGLELVGIVADLRHEVLERRQVDASARGGVLHLVGNLLDVVDGDLPAVGAGPEGLHEAADLVAVRGVEAVGDGGEEALDQARAPGLGGVAILPDDAGDDASDDQERDDAECDLSHDVRLPPR